MVNYTINMQEPKNIDVLVLGGGPAGIAAAIASARNGAKTMLIERYGVLGGSATVCLVGPFMSSFSNDGSVQLCRGIFEELVNRMVSVGGAIHPSKVRKQTSYCGYRMFGHDHVTPFDPEAMKRVSIEMIKEEGVNLRLHTFFADVIMNENTIGNVITLSKSGFKAFKPKIVIDCTGDADVANASGVPTRMGRKEDGLTQPLTMFFRMANIDDEKIDEYYAKHHKQEGERLFATIIDEKKKTGEWTVSRDKVAMYKTTTPGIWRVNTTRVQGLNGTKSEDLTKAEEEGRKQVYQLVDFFSKYLPGFEDAVLMDTALQIGVRDTRRIVGEYTLKIDDLINATEFDDVVGMNGFPVDIHDPKGIHGGCGDEYNTADAYELPYRILVPQKIDNLLAAGRDVSADFESLGAIRVMPSCMVMGQAAGTAAALSVSQNTIPRLLNVDELQKRLLKQDVYLGKRFKD